MLYLLHSTVPLHRGNGLEVRHYLGWAHSAEAGERRIRDHQQGRSKVKIIRAYLRAGGTLLRVRTWPEGSTALESYLKANGNLDRHCPICREKALERQRVYQQQRHARSKQPSSEPSHAPATETGGTLPVPSPGNGASPGGKSHRARRWASGTPSGSPDPANPSGGTGWPVRARQARTPDTSSAGTGQRST
jgi:hypothetical protein